jgi:CubicO group peptidase (beta-lactamase class C family)
LAAAIVVHVSRMPFSTFVRREVLDAAGLRDTGQAINAHDASLAPIIGELPPRLTNLSWTGLAYYSTTHDFQRWIETLIQGRLLSRANVAELFRPVAPIQEGSTALGWFVGLTPHGTQRIFTRGNEDFGPNSSIYYYPAQRALIVVLTHAGDASDEVSWSRTLQQRLEAALGL